MMVQDLIKPTIDIIDKGTGLLGSEFDKTILSINHGNKLSRDKSYLIVHLARADQLHFLSHSHNNNVKER